MKVMQDALLTSDLQVCCAGYSELQQLHEQPQYRR